MQRQVYQEWHRVGIIFMNRGLQVKKGRISHKQSVELAIWVRRHNWQCPWYNEKLLLYLCHQEQPKTIIYLDWFLNSKNWNHFLYSLNSELLSVISSCMDWFQRVIHNIFWLLGSNRNYFTSKLEIKDKIKWFHIFELMFLLDN